MSLRPWVEYQVANGRIMYMISSGYFNGIVLMGDIDIENPKVKAVVKEMQFTAPFIAAQVTLLDYTPSYWEYDGSTVIEEAEIVLSAPFDIIPSDCESRTIAHRVLNGGFKRPVRQKEPETMKPGYVYLLSSADGTHKIGRTKDPKQRLNSFKSMRMQVEYVCLIQTKNMNRLEADLHIKFKDKRIQGEWFDLDTDDIEYIKGLA